MRDNEKRFNVSIGAGLDKDLENVSRTLGVTKAEAVRRALMLFRHAVKADKVTLTTSNKEQTVLIK